MNTFTLAVAGSRKTQSIVDACADETRDRRRLAVTYTIEGQEELSRRLHFSCRPRQVPEVSGWYSFLMRHWIRPFLPLLYPDRRLRGLNFDGEPSEGRYATGERRYFDSDGRAYRLHLSKLAFEVNRVSEGAVLDRLQRIYEEMYIDEAQDLTGWDLDIIAAMLKSRLELHLVGDVRQSVFDTNPQDLKNKQYRGLKMLDWIASLEKRKLLVVRESLQTWRSNNEIATFSDSIFPSSWNLGATESLQSWRTGHDGVFALAPEHVDDYVDIYSPLCLRSSQRTAAGKELPFWNFGKVKGRTVDRVLIFPTGPIDKFLRDNTELKPKAACGFYVAVTRARYSVAIVTVKPEQTRLPVWSPEADRDLTRN